MLWMRKLRHREQAGRLKSYNWEATEGGIDTGVLWLHAKLSPSTLGLPTDAPHHPCPSLPLVHPPALGWRLEPSLDSLLLFLSLSPVLWGWFLSDIH